jgi:DNA-binding CsgD family transcriptional regulator
MNIANVYNLENQIDSAKFYIEKSLAIQAKEPALLISTYLLLSEMEEKEGRYKEALQYFKIYSDYVKKTVDDNKSKTLLELQEKYDFEIMENQKKQLVIEKQLMFLFAMFFILLISYFAFFLHRKNVQKKARIVEIEQKIETLMEMNNNYSEKEQSTKNILIRHLNILKKVALIKEQINEEDRKKGKPLIEKFNRIVYEQETFNWDLFYQSLNEIRSGFYNRMREQYPQLEDSEFQICCLYCEHFSSDEIAAVMNFSVNTIHKKTSILRRKIGVFSHVNMVDFLTEK